MKDLFSGSLGKLNNHGGSRMFTTPNTVYVPPEYEVETDVPSVAEFVTCTLDGRLWVFRRSRRYYVAVFRWDEETEKLVFVSTTVLSNANIIGRGIDWILTDTAIIQASDNEPYIFTANLFADNGISFLYSVLRSSVVNSTWGKSEDTGNSEGYGSFYRSALIQSVSKHYSLLPSVGDWNIIKNFLVRRADNPLSDVHNSMLNLRPLIPLEFKGSTPAYGVDFNSDINLTYFNGELWGRGLYHIGRCYIIPAVFDEDGTPQEFYLYISPDYPCSPYKSNSSVLTKADWINMGILHTNKTVYGFLCGQSDSLDNGLYYSSETPKLYVPLANEWQELSENGNMFVDTLNNSGLVLHEDGAIFLNGDNPSYECKGLNQWLAPSVKVDVVSPQSVISSFDNGTLVTYLQQGLHRELLTKKETPLTVKNYSEKRLSLDETDKNNKKVIQVNNIKSYSNIGAVDWENVYKSAVDIKFLSMQYLRDYITWTPPSSWSPPLVSDLGAVPIFELYAYPDILYPRPATGSGSYAVEWSSRPYESGEVGTNVSPGPCYHLIQAYHDIALKCTFGYIHPQTGKLIQFDGATQVPSSIVEDTSKPYWNDERWAGSQLYDRYNLEIKDNSIYARYSCYNYGSGSVLLHMCEIPQEILSYVNFCTEGNLSMTNTYPLKIDGICDITTREQRVNWTYQKLFYGDLSSAKAIFLEDLSKTIFFCDIPSYLKEIKISEYNIRVNGMYTFPDWSSYNENMSICTRALHSFLLYDDNDYLRSENSNGINLFIIIFKSEIHPEIFDFQSEVERSKLT